MTLRDACTNVSPPTCPTNVVLSNAWMPPNGNMFNVSLTSVPIRDPNVPGWINITDVQFYDTLNKKLPTMPLAEWTHGRLTGEATVCRWAPPLGLHMRQLPQACRIQDQC